jgi:hypothetical protein
MLQLTKMIHEYRQTHIIDSRYRRIEALTKIVDFLEKENLYHNSGISGFLLLQDIWDYYPQESRPFGFKVKFGLGMSYQKSRFNLKGSKYGLIYNITNGGSDTTNYSEYEKSSRIIREDNRTDIYLIGKLEYQVPVNLKWHFSMNLNSIYYIDSESKLVKFSEIELSYPLMSTQYSRSGKEYNHYGNIALGTSIRYYADSRTELSSTAEYELRNVEAKSYTQYYIRGLKHYYDQNRIWAKIFSASGEFKYRISIPTVLNIAITYFDLSTEEARPGSFVRNEDDSFQFSASISHYIF